MPMLAELADLVIGVDTYADTHTAALVAADSGALLDTITITVTADADGYAQLLALAESRGGLRGWAIKGAGGYEPAAALAAAPDAATARLIEVHRL